MTATGTPITSTTDPTGTSPGAGTVTVNGEEVALTDDVAHLAALLARLAPSAVPATDRADATAAEEADAPAPTGVAAALNDQVVPRGAWATTTLHDGDRVEIVTAVQGG